MKNYKPITLKILALILGLFTCALVACGTSTGSQDTAAPGVGVTIDFVAEQLTLNPGECTLVEWHVQGGYSVDLNGETVDFTGQKSVCPEMTTTYQISVDAGDRMVGYRKSEGR